MKFKVRFPFVCVHLPSSAFWRGRTFYQSDQIIFYANPVIFLFIFVLFSIKVSIIQIEKA